MHNYDTAQIHDNGSSIMTYALADWAQKHPEYGQSHANGLFVLMLIYPGEKQLTYLWVYALWMNGQLVSITIDKSLML